MVWFYIKPYVIKKTNSTLLNSIRLNYLILCPTGILHPRAGLRPFCVALDPRIDFEYRTVTLLLSSNYLKEVHSLDCEDSIHFDVLYFASNPFGKNRDGLSVVSLYVNLTQNLSSILLFFNCLCKVGFLFLYTPCSFHLFFACIIFLLTILAHALICVRSNVLNITLYFLNFNSLLKNFSIYTNTTRRLNTFHIYMIVFLFVNYISFELLSNLIQSILRLY